MHHYSVKALKAQQIYLSSHFACHCLAQRMLARR